jgi:hypothetical protein
MNGPNWLRRHSSATATAPERNGSAPSETELRLRPRVADAPAAVRVRPRAGRLLQPLPLVGAVLVLVALVGYWSVYRASTKRTPVLVAAHALSAGTVLRADDLRTGELAGDAGTMAAVTLALPDPSLASALALANSDAKIDLLRESGRARTAIPPASETRAP